MRVVNDILLLSSYFLLGGVECYLCLLPVFLCVFSFLSIGMNSLFIR